MSYYFLNNKIVPSTKASIPLGDIGLQRGYAVFDFTRTYNGKPFMLKEHLQRFIKSARLLSIPVPYSISKTEQIIAELLKKNKFSESTVKVGLTGGPLSGSLSFTGKDASFFVMVDKLIEFPQSFFERGVKLVSVDYQRGLSTAKTIDYAVAVKEQLRCNREGAFEVLYVPGGLITESATSNFFIFKGNTLITPNEHILFGITRDLVLKLAKKNFKIELRPIRYAELKGATEAFLVASKKDIMPVVQVDDIKIKDGKPGKNTEALTAGYFEYLRKNYGYIRK